MTNNRTIQQLETLLELIENDCAHYRQRRDNAFDQSIKDYYDKKIRRARSDFNRIARRLNFLKGVTPF